MTKYVSDEIQFAYDQYRAVASIENALTLTKAVYKYTVDGVLSTLKRKVELQVFAVSVFGSEAVFIEYPCSLPLALGKRPIELLMMITGVQIIMDELLRIEHGILS